MNATVLFVLLLAQLLGVSKGAVQDDGPLVLYNLTIEEFVAKADELAHVGANASGSRADGHDDDRAAVGKRAVVGGERRNSIIVQLVVEELATLCEGHFGPGWRPLSGKCINLAQITVTCGNPEGTAADDEAIEHNCPPPQICASVVGNNFRDSIATFGYCGARIKVDGRQQYGQEVDYIGSWFPESPKSPGTYNDYVAMKGGIEGAFLFAGGQGNNIRKEYGLGLSWACFKCPGGLLKITARRSTDAVGLSFPVKPL
ncbi:hypothetical protein C8034_v004053 [Colletotrichum sidae]|uniref:Secreted in xylem 1 protein n=1 Tax=Colletotrichum sidae TaxID=1347389 RepID=A0A4R8T8P1_9PEZI|nr:hypothetical protein C8034_v004053 [Colletotrichum sidae]